MEHLLYVLWHDYWKPWILARLEFIACVALGLVLVAMWVLGFLWTVKATNDAMAGLI